MRKQLQSAFNKRQYMESEDFELFYYNDLHFSGVESHTHDYYEFYFFVEGDVSVCIAGDSHALHPGDVMLIPPETAHHTISHIPERPYRRFVFWINRSFFDGLCTQSEDYAYIAKYAREHKRYIYHNDVIDFNAVQAKLFRLLEEIRSDRFGRDTKISLCISDLLLHVNRISFEQNNPKKPREQQRLYENLIQYIEDHLDEDLSLDKLADTFYVSKYHIAHIFKDNLGLSIHQYITKKRLAACRDALLGDANISKTFLLYGYKDYSVFYRAFKKEYGISPKEYKEIHGIKNQMESIPT